MFLHAFLLKKVILQHIVHATQMISINIWKENPSINSRRKGIYHSVLGVWKL